MRRTPLLGLALGLATSGLLAASLAQAQARPAATGAPVVSHRTGADSAERAEEVRRYWTKARMRQAVPKVAHGNLRPETTGKGSRGKPGGGGGSGGDGYLGGPWTQGGLVVKTTGKVFFTERGTNYVCSGSSTSAANGSLVTTAGHCVNEGPGAFVTNFAFVPAYDHGSRPYGTWPATQLFTTSQWQQSGDYDYDVGMAKVGTLNGKTLAATVGTQNIAFNTARPTFVYSFGYPAARPYDGTTLDYCSGTTGLDTLGGTNDYRLACNMTGGSSGGPWLRDFDPATGVGTQVSVNSFGYRGEKNAMYGPYFGNVIQALYDTASRS